MSELRQRQVPSNSGSSRPDSSAAQTSSRRQQRGNSIGVLDILRVLVTLAVASCGLSYYMTSSESLLWGYKPWFTRWPVVVRYLQGPVLLTPDELALYNGSDPNLPIYLAVNGSIFDVSANPMVYGPGGHYGFFSGRDATRAFVTGCFEEDLTPDIRGVEEMFIPIDDDTDENLTSGEKKIRREQETRLAKARVHKQVQHWENFFRNSQKYFEVGKVVGGDEAATGEKRELCEGAKKQRPKRKDMKRGQGH